MSVHIRRWMSLTLLSASFAVPRAAVAQSRMFEACTQGALANCAGVRLTSQLGVGPGGWNLFEIGLQNLGSQTTPGLATSVYFLSLLTGQDPASEIDASPTPTAIGGASISDPLAWSLAETGDAIFLSAPGNNGIGGCASAAPVNGIGQMAQTCGDDQFVTFSFYTSRTFDLDAITIADIEFVAVDGDNPADSCNADSLCDIAPVTTTPEPGTMVLALSGLLGIAGIRRRSTNTTEA